MINQMNRIDAHRHATLMGSIGKMMKVKGITKSSISLDALILKDFSSPSYDHSKEIDVNWD